MIDKAIGDLSKQDRKVLKAMAEKSRSILEVGVGASTQILTHYARGKVVSYDTDQRWIERIRDVVFPQVGVEGECEFRLLDYRMNIQGQYDFAFIDCAREYRLPSAFEAWKRITAGGSLSFHDTRRDRDIENTFRFLRSVFREVARIECNYEDSNITIIWKRPKPAKYVNWHKGQTKEELGIEWLK